MTSEREAYVHIQLPGSLETVPAALLRVQTLPDGIQIGRFRYGDRAICAARAVALDPFRLPWPSRVFEFTQLKGYPWCSARWRPMPGAGAIENKLERSPSADLRWRSTTVPRAP